MTSGIVITLCVFGIITGILSILATAKFGKQHYISTIVKVASIACFALVLGFLNVTRSEEAFNLFFWDNTNKVLMKAFYTAAVAIVLLFVADITLIVTSFFSDKEVAAK